MSKTIYSLIGAGLFSGQSLLSQTIELDPTYFTSSPARGIGFNYDGEAVPLTKQGDVNQINGLVISWSADALVGSFYRFTNDSSSNTTNIGAGNSALMGSNEFSSRGNGYALIPQTGNLIKIVNEQLDPKGSNYLPTQVNGKPVAGFSVFDDDSSDIGALASHENINGSGKITIIFQDLATGDSTLFGGYSSMTLNNPQNRLFKDFDITTNYEGSGKSAINVLFADNDSNYFMYNYAVVPEPSTSLLFGAGLSALLLRRRRA